MDKEDVVYIDTMGHYSATKMNEIMPFAAICFHLEIGVLCEAS